MECREDFAGGARRRERKNLPLEDGFKYERARVQEIQLHSQI
jgi:hypothetical protein